MRNAAEVAFQTSQRIGGSSARGTKCMNAEIHRQLLTPKVLNACDSIVCATTNCCGNHLFAVILMRHRPEANQNHSPMHACLLGLPGWAESVMGKAGKTKKWSGVNTSKAMILRIVQTSVRLNGTGPQHMQMQTCVCAEWPQIKRMHCSSSNGSDVMTNAVSPWSISVHPRNDDLCSGGHCLTPRPMKHISFMMSLSAVAANGIEQTAINDRQSDRQQSDHGAQIISSSSRVRGLASWSSLHHPGILQPHSAEIRF